MVQYDKEGKQEQTQHNFIKLAILFKMLKNVNRIGNLCYDPTFNVQDKVITRPYSHETFLRTIF